MKNKLKHYPPLTHAADLKEICNPLAELNINYFAHVKINTKNEFSAIGLKPEFVKLYLEKEYYNFDIHMGSQHNNESYIMWDLLNLTNETNELDADSRAFDFYHSFTIVQQGDEGSEYFHFAAPAANHQANANYLRNLDSLKKFTYYFKDKVNEHKQLKTSHHFKFSIDEETANFSTNDPLQMIDELKLSINRIFVSDTNAYLTKREFECLHWLSIGKTLHDIANIMAVTERTVKAHVSSIKEKTGCHNLFQLGALYQKLKPIT